MWFKHSMSIAQQLIPIYNTTVHKNKSKVTINLRHQYAPSGLYFKASAEAVEIPLDDLIQVVSVTGHRVKITKTTPDIQVL